MSEQPSVDFAKSWLRYQDDQRDEDKWAIFELQDLVLDDQGRAIRAVAWLVDEAESAWHLTMIGAGPTEDLLHLYGPSTLVELERNVPDKEKLVQVLSNLSPDNPEAEAALGEVIERARR